MIEYYITQHDDGTYQIAKFIDGGSEPVAVYTITNEGKTCDCIAGSKRGKCKHTAMAKAWDWNYYYQQRDLRSDPVLVPLSQELIND